MLFFFVKGFASWAESNELSLLDLSFNIFVNNLHAWNILIRDIYSASKVEVNICAPDQFSSWWP